MELKLERTDFGDTATFGELLLDNTRIYTLEDKVRPAGEKVPGQTAIPAGRYKVIIDDSKRFGRPMPHILDVPGFEGVRIHTGNTDKDTEGCVLVGLEKIDGYVLGRSRDAFNLFFPKLEEALKTGEVWISIS